MEILQERRHKGILSKPSEKGKFHFAVTGEAVGNEREIFEQIHFSLTELNLSCPFIEIKWHVLISPSVEEI